MPSIVSDVTVPRSTAFTLRTADGIDLRAEQLIPSDVTAAAVLLHPHPLMGGDMHAPVVEHLFDELASRGVAVLRFDFRGAGGSSGSHGGGRSEAADAMAALDSLASATTSPVWLVGWSFGADVSLQVAAPTVAGWIAIAPPLRSVPQRDMLAANDLRPCSLLVPEHDQYNPPEHARPATAEWTATSVEVVPGADHFLGGRMSTLTDMVMRSITDPPTPPA